MIACNRPHAIVFPGQGTQTVGMGRAIVRSSAAARAVYDEACAALGWAVDTLCFEGPGDRLNAALYAPVAVHVTSLAVAASLAEKGVRPVAAAGHSVGEFAALVFCGALAPDEGLRLVDRRAQLMASVDVDGTMLAIIGLPASVVARLCAGRRSTGGILQLAADNSPRHVTVAGTRQEIDALARRLVSQRGVRTASIRASGPFHTDAYAQVQEAWADVLESAALSRPRTPFVSSVTGSALTSVKQIRRALVAQLTDMVRWRESALALGDVGARCLIEAAETQGASRLAQLTLGRAVTCCARPGPGLGVLPSPLRRSVRL